MCNRNNIFRANKGLSLILTTILAVACFLGVPGNSKSYASASDELYFSILHTNDIHSELIPYLPVANYSSQGENSTIGGVARLATAINEIRESKVQEGEPVLLFDAGDFLGGAPFAWLALDGCAAELTIMQQMGYNAVAIGNHEYDYGPDVLAQYLVKAGYPEAQQKTLVLASNTEAPPDNPLGAQGLYRKTGMFVLENGLKVGVFSIIGKNAVELIGDAGDVQFLDQYATARQMVKELKEQGANVIVCISHSGVDEDQAMAREVPGINVIVGGHSHTALFKPILVGDTIIVQAGCWGEYLGQLELAYNPDTGKVRVRNEEDGHPFLIPIDSSFASDPEINALVQQYTLILNAYIAEMTGGKIDNIMDTVAKSDFILSNQPQLSETPLGDFVADAMRMVVQNITGERVDIAGEVSGCIRTSISPDSAGNISLYEIGEATSVGHGLDGYPGCPVVSFYLTGEEVYRLLEIDILAERLMGDPSFLQCSGLKYSYNPRNAVLFTIPFAHLPIPTTHAVTNLELYTGDGIQPVSGEGYVPINREDQKLYHVVTDAYILHFLPMVKSRLPRLAVVPKNAEGEPVPPEKFDELIVHQADGRELKVWEAVAIYAAAQPAGVNGTPQIPNYYDGVDGRINKTWTFPWIGWLLLILVAIAAGIAFLVVRRRKHRRAVTQNPL